MLTQRKGNILEPTLHQEGRILLQNWLRSWHNSIEDPFKQTVVTATLSWAHPDALCLNLVVWKLPEGGSRWASSRGLLLPSSYQLLHSWRKPRPLLIYLKLCCFCSAVLRYSNANWVLDCFYMLCYYCLMLLHFDLLPYVITFRFMPFTYCNNILLQLIRSIIGF